MNVRVTNSFSKITHKEIEQFEIEYNLELAQEFQEFLLVHNGGEPEPAAFKFHDPVLAESSSIVQCFGGIHNGQNHSLHRYLQTHRDRIPPDLLPIARDWFGNYLCIGISKDNFGEIHLWDHEQEFDDMNGIAIVSHDNVYFVAENFNEFLNSLHHAQ